MNDNEVITLIDDVKDLGGRYGLMASANTLSYPQVMGIISYLEGDGESRAVAALEVRVAERDGRIAALNGTTGGLQKRINKLQKQLEDQTTLKENNRKLSRIANAASDLVTNLAAADDEYNSSSGETLEEHPLYARLAAEVG